MSDRMTPEDLHRKGFVPDGKGGYHRATGREAEQIRYIPSNTKIILPANMPKGMEIKVVNTMNVADLQISKYIHIESDAITLQTGERLYIKYSFNIPPRPAPRLSQSDKWKVDPYHPDPKMRQRPCVTRYFAWRAAFRALCRENGYELEEVLKVVFIMPFPKYLSRKKREMKNGQKHQQKPDADNLIKSIKDSFGVDDGFVWDERSVKVWGEKGKILIF